MKIAIIGSNGFIGKNISIRFPDALKITRETFDIFNYKQVETFFNDNKVDYIIHCVTVGGSRLKDDDSNVLLENLKSYMSIARLGIPMIFFSSGAALYADDKPYGFSKKIIEEMNHPHVKILRIFGCWGPFEPEQRFTYAVKSGHVNIHQDRYFDFIHVDDVCNLVANIMSNHKGDRIIDAVTKPTLLLSEFAKQHNATYTIEKPGLGNSYVSR
jgi:GDP-L-fucose synthase